MDWFSFIAGALTGWIIEWLVDLFYWRRKQSRWSNEHNRLEADLSHSQTTVGGLRAREVELNQQLSIERGDLEAANSNLGILQADLDAARAETAALNNQLNFADADKQALADQLNGELTAARAELAALHEQMERVLVANRALQAENSTLGARKDVLESDAARFLAVSGLTVAAAAAVKPTPEHDDLTIIEGIGPKIEELLNQHDIYTFAQLADTEVSDLDTIIRGAGSRFQTANPETWPRQARLAANRDWTRLDALKAQLQGGVRRPSTVEVAAVAAAAAAAAEPPKQQPPPSDDLTIIEGIGPKIAELLNQHDIYTFAQLADTSVPDLETILRGGGSRFQTANPETWPRQARLAANRDWPRLDALKAQLQGGVRRPSAVEVAAVATAAASAAEPPKPQPPPSDDLTIIEGIGPKIAELLNQHDIYTFAQLADTNVQDLETILRGGGTRFQTANPESWPRQARLAANREWPRLDALKAQLQGGVRRPASEPQDDLAVLEGIGPKIADILYQNGIKTYGQLARMEPARLRLLLDEAGPAYRMADPTSWPEQASWAAVGNWDRLQALKDELDAGRRQA